MNRIASPSRTHRAFTLIELLVVIAIIVVISAFLLPAFTRIIESSNFTAAINSVSATLGNARARAINTGRPTGVAFLFDAETERYSLLVLEATSLQGGVLSDLPSRADRYAQAFIPASNSAPVELPRRTGVFALASPAVRGHDDPDIPIETRSGSTTWKWYAGEGVNFDVGDSSDDIPLWLFPRNDPRVYTENPADNARLGENPWDKLLEVDTDPPLTISAQEAIQAIRNASTFFVLFAADGTVQHVDRSGGRDFKEFYIEYIDEPFAENDDNRKPYDSATNFDPENFGRPPVSVENRRRNPEVMMRTASQLAVVDLNRLSEGVGLPRAWLVRSNESRLPAPSWLNIENTDPIDSYKDNGRAREVSRWIDRNAEIIGFNRYTGNVIRRSTQ